jgi:hypothetical protein
MEGGEAIIRLELVGLISVVVSHEASSLFSIVIGQPQSGFSGDAFFLRVLSKITFTRIFRPSIDRPRVFLGKTASCCEF